jgi:hypothetical protein
MTLAKPINTNLFNVLLKALAAVVFVLVSAGFLPAQVINYDIDAGFDTGIIFSKEVKQIILSIKKPHYTCPFK